MPKMRARGDRDSSNHALRSKVETGRSFSAGEETAARRRVHGEKAGRSVDLVVGSNAQDRVGLTVSLHTSTINLCFKYICIFKFRQHEIALVQISDHRQWKMEVVEDLRLR